MAGASHCSLYAVSDKAVLHRAGGDDARARQKLGRRARGGAGKEKKIRRERACEIWVLVT